MEEPGMPTIDPTGSPTDPRIGTGQVPADGTHRRREGETVRHGTEAARVNLSDHASLSQLQSLAHAENLAAAEGSVGDIDRATEMVKQLTAQISQQGREAFPAQANVSPRAALNLLS
jgi:hypothetical protein